MTSLKQLISILFLFFCLINLQVWSNDRIRSCEHGVILKEINKARYSVGFYSFVDGLIYVPEEMVDQDYPLRYHEPYDHWGAVARFAKENQHRYPTST